MEGPTRVAVASHHLLIFHYNNIPPSILNPTISPSILNPSIPCVPMYSNKRRHGDSHSALSSDTSSSDEDMQHPLSKKLKANTDHQAPSHSSVAGSPPQTLHSPQHASNSSISALSQDNSPAIQPINQSIYTDGYEPELDQSRNPFYYHSNRLLYEAHLERTRHGKY
ncbi:hypothetical protein BV898_16014 [Hypsibius exemplaris]|uniref:Uncharacterized protein n=1 Tax=Hypsibius exemplaris TaxID=2072580 RepID=A0A9X6NCQ7_HYPEX|nr:hypothetical protein BV898_16014 [Hypsibius exemplaris]